MEKGKGVKTKLKTSLRKVLVFVRRVTFLIVALVVITIAGLAYYLLQDRDHNNDEFVQETTVHGSGETWEEVYTGQLELVVGSTISVRDATTDLFAQPKRCVISDTTTLFSLDNQPITLDTVGLGDTVELTISITQLTSDEDRVHNCKSLVVKEKFDEEKFYDNLEQNYQTESAENN